MDFNYIIGHELPIKTLKNSIKKGTVSHSYIFQGEEGLGKKMIARVFAKTLLCKEQKEEPCNRCTSCMKFDGDNHPDFTLIDPEKGLIKKGEVEALIKSIAMAPFESSRKVFVINDSHKMNKEAQNALLKTLEEPPEYINIILVTSNSKNLLPTILSRGIGIKFYPVESYKIVNLLSNMYDINEDKANFIADFTKGSVGKSIEISTTENFFEKRDKVIGLIDSLLNGDKSKALSSIELFNDNKDNIDEILDIFLFWFRDLMIFKEVGETDLIINKDKTETFSRHLIIDFTRISDIIEKVQETKENILRNVNFQLSIETMLLNIQEEY